MGKSEKDNISDIAKYYGQNQEDNRLHIQQLEFQLTLRLLHKYLTPNSKILEIGAGSGHYTLELARQGHHITSIELVESLAQTSRTRLKEMGLQDQAHVLVGDGRELIQIDNEAFDVVLCMGPFYHLESRPERNQLMRDISSKLVEQGVLISTFLSRIGLMGYMLARFPQWAAQSPKQVEDVLNLGYLPDHPRNGEFRGYYTTTEDIQKLHSQNSYKLIRIHSQDPCIGPIDEIYNQLPMELKIIWADLLAEISADPLALGSGRSLLSVARKK